MWDKIEGSLLESYRNRRLLKWSRGCELWSQEGLHLDRPCLCHFSTVWAWAAGSLLWVSVFLICKNIGNSTSVPYFPFCILCILSSQYLVFSVNIVLILMMKRVWIKAEAMGMEKGRRDDNGVRQVDCISLRDWLKGWWGTATILPRDPTWVELGKWWFQSLWKRNQEGQVTGFGGGRLGMRGMMSSVWALVHTWDALKTVGYVGLFLYEEVGLRNGY